MCMVFDVTVIPRARARVAARARAPPNRCLQAPPTVRLRAAASAQYGCSRGALTTERRRALQRCGQGGGAATSHVRALARKQRTHARRGPVLAAPAARPLLPRRPTRAR